MEKGIVMNIFCLYSFMTNINGKLCISLFIVEIILTPTVWKVTCDYWFIFKTQMCKINILKQSVFIKKTFPNINVWPHDTYMDIGGTKISAGSSMGYRVTKDLYSQISSWFLTPDL